MSLAYSISSGTESAATTSAAGGLNDLMTPFNNFVNSINAVGTSALQVGPPMPFVAPRVPTNILPTNLLRTGAQNGLQSADNWASQNLGFPVSNIVLGFLHIFSWTLGAVKGGVDWVIGLCR